MPFSEDEYDSQSGFASEPGNAQNLSKAELRKTNKPIMEKKRRARINNCLNELKDLLLDAMNKDPARHSKLEKADILELTVKHLQAIQRQQLAAAVAADPAVLHRFRSGFGDCAAEVRRYLSRLAPPPATPPGLRARLGTHLDTCLTGIERLAPHDYPKFPDTHLDDRLGLKLDPRLGLKLDERLGLRLDDREVPKLDDRPGLKHEDRTKKLNEDRRPSAFRYVRRPSSPPLSPISCDSACDSSTEPETPPRPQNTLIPQVTYPTPPSRSASDQDSSPETQKPTVSSTTISPESRVQQAALDLKSKKFAEPLSIVIDVENYKIGIDASPKRPLDYRHKLKRTASHSVTSRSHDDQPLSKIPRTYVPIGPPLYRPTATIPELATDRPNVLRSVISHTAVSLAESSVSEKRTTPEQTERVTPEQQQKRATTEQQERVTPEHQQKRATTDQQERVTPEQQQKRATNEQENKAIPEQQQKRATNEQQKKVIPEQQKGEADTSARSPEQKAHGSGDAMWRPW